MIKIISIPKDAFQSPQCEKHCPWGGNHTLNLFDKDVPTRLRSTRCQRKNGHNGLCWAASGEVWSETKEIKKEIKKES